MKYTEQEILDKIKKFYDAYASLKEKSNMQAQTHAQEEWKRHNSLHIQRFYTVQV